MPLITCHACGQSFDSSASPDGRCPLCGQLAFVPFEAVGTQMPMERPGVTLDHADPRAMVIQERQAFVRALFSASPVAFVAIAIITINVLVFLYAGLTGAGWINSNLQRMVDLGADYWALTTGGQWWRTVTSIFLHFGILHLAFNMWALYTAGPLTERLYGNWFFLLIYLFAGVTGSFASLAFERGAVSAGASGAIFGVFGALIAYLLAQPGVFPRGMVQPMLKSALIFVAINIAFGLSHKGISNAAHLGGLAGGFAMGLILARPLDRTRRASQQISRLAAAIVLGSGILYGAFAAVPKISPGEVALVAAVKSGFRQEVRLAERYNQLLAQSKKEKWSDPQWADKLETEVLPGWEQARADLAKVELPPGSSSRRTQELILEYFTLRGDEHRLLIKAARAENNALAEQAAGISKRADEMIPVVEQAMKKLPM